MCQVLPPYCFNKITFAFFKLTLSYLPTFLQLLHSSAQPFQPLQLKKLPLWAALISWILYSPHSKGFHSGNYCLCVMSINSSILNSL